MHHWKLSEEEEGKSFAYLEYNGLCGLGGRAMDGKKEVRGRKC